MHLCHLLLSQTLILRKKALHVLTLKDVLYQRNRHWIAESASYYTRNQWDSLTESTDFVIKCPQTNIWQVLVRSFHLGSSGVTVSQVGLT